MFDDDDVERERDEMRKQVVAHAAKNELKLTIAKRGVLIEKHSVGIDKQWK